MARRKLTPRPGIDKIATYVPGKSKVAGLSHAIKLSSNENPFGCSPAALEAFKSASDLAAYPDGGASALREAIGAAFGLDPARIVCGAGSDEILNLLAQAYLGPGDEAIYSEHGFLVYPIVILARGATPVIAPETDCRVDVDKLLACVTDKTRIVYLANPNNPTGSYISFDEVKRLREALPEDVLLVLDAAYAEYVRKNDYEAGIEMVATSDNTVMTRTFSKIHGLAALRVGWAYCPAEVAEVLNKIRGPFNVSGPAMAAGVAAIADTDFVQKSAEHNALWRDKLTEALTGLGLKVTPSAANFVLVHFPEAPGTTAADADAHLLSKGIILRQVGAYGLPNCLRMSIGSEEQNLATLAALEEFLAMTGDEAGDEAGTKTGEGVA
ncbi:histidinol-phosphate transaminase [Methyloligella sp. 2.7D]|uniref:histidinol-phosphate transaminase n=1 Tax=unclassified Methyloligella TaxID=2625955 RepID=UPI00157D622B|nr:histidinol-phosphate transaminase [Methyloligella sp. GL2]QKP76464.1 histidinol-phosphate transaminase [Methyloligella sp. GL2]